MQDLDELQSEKMAIVGGGDHENHEIYLNIEEEEKRERGRRREKKKEPETENDIEVDEEGIEIGSRTNSRTKTRTRTRTQNRESGEISINWHLMTPAELVKAVECHEMNSYIDFDNPRRSHGLTEMDSVLRLERNGKNVLTGSKESSALQQYLAKFLDPLMVVLIVAGILSFIIWALDTSVAVNLYLALALVIIVVVSASLAYVQEGRSRAVMAHFVKLMPRKCRVIRTGREVLIDASDLVVGDLVLLRIGDSVPADIRLIFTSELKIESSALTGESVPVTCETDCEDDSMALFEAPNIAWSSTNVMEGEGVGVVFACGNDSRMGRIGKLTNSTENVESTLQKELKRFVYILVAFASAQAILFYCIALGRKKDPVQSLVLCLVVIMVANVPQGLPSTVVSLLTIVGKRLADNNVNVKKLQNVETLGSCTVIASDKTGTITQNKMSVSQVWVDMRCIGAELAKSEMPVSAMTSTMAQLVRMPMHARLRKTSEEGIRWESSPNVLSGLTSKFQDSNLPHTSFGSEAVIKVVRTFANLELVATLCNRAKFEDEKQLTDEEAAHLFAIHNNIGAGRNRRYETSNQLLEKLQQDRKRNVLGDASDKALFNFISGRQSIELLRYQYRIIFEIPFSSSKKFSLVVIQPIGTVRRFLLMKGAPEVVLERCQYFQQHGVRYTINEEFLQAFDAACRAFADDGERVLGFAMMELSVDSTTEQSQSSSKSDEKGVSPDKEMDEINANNLPLTGYQFLGMMSLVDPPKPKVAGAVEECRNAGIKVIMVTGDHPLTAVAIAGQVGIVKHPTKNTLALQLGCREEEVDDKLVKSIVVTGRELNTFTNADWDRVLSKEEIVFARTTPEHKLSIVQHLQAMGHVVAVTGDGVNDAPALKKADIGVAMGINGSDVARSAGDIVLMDDDFSSIVLGIKEGRVLFDNIMKTTAYTLTHLWPEVMPVLLNIAFDVPLAMNSLPVLAIDTGTELAPAIALAYEKAEGDVMHRKPRNVKKDRLASWGLLSYSYAQIGCLEFLIAWLGFLLVFNHHDVPIKDLAWSATKYWNSTADSYVLSNGKVLSRDQQLTILGQAQALYWFLVVSCQMIHVYLVRTRTQSILEHGLFGNMILNYGLLVEICVCGLVLFVPTLANDVMLFDNNIATGLWFLFLVGWGVLFLYIEGFKWMKRNNYGGRIFKSLGY